MEKNSPSSETLTEERHIEAAALVGHYAQVEYPRRGTLKGLLTGYYRATGSFRIDYFPNAARLRWDSGVCVKERLFRSEQFSCCCTLTMGGPIQDSATAAKYFDRRLVQFPQRKGKVGHMLGKILKSDWGNDGVFLGILVDYQQGQKFRVMYMDGDDEWGIFKGNLFALFDLQDGESRSITWFDLCPEKLLAVKAKPEKKPAMPQLTATEKEEKEIQQTTAAMLDSIFEKLMVKEARTETEAKRGAFTSAFLQTSGMDMSDLPSNELPGKQESKKLIKKSMSKRPLDATDGRTGVKKSQKMESVGRTKRARSHANGTIDNQPAMKKAKNKPQQEKEKRSEPRKGTPIWHPQPKFINKAMTTLAPPPEGPREVGEISNGVASEQETSNPVATSDIPNKSKVREGPRADKNESQPQLDGLMSPNPDREKSRFPRVLNAVLPPADKAAPDLSNSDVKPSAPPESAKLSGSASSSTFSPAVVTSPHVRKPSSYSSVEIGLEMQNFIAQLEHLTQSKERIANATSTAISVAHCGGAKRVIEAVLVQIQEPVGSERKVALLYLLDSILQYALKDRIKAPLGRSTGETIIFLDLVEERLKDLVETLSGEYDSYTKLEKVLELWKERQLYTEASMDKALGWLHESAPRHARFIEDDRLRTEGKIPHYIRRPNGPQCHRMILTDVFGSIATLDTLAGKLPVPKRLMKKEREDRWDVYRWDYLDTAVDAMIREMKGAKYGFDTTTEEDPEEGEIPEQPPLPPGPPPADEDDPNFVPPLPSDDEDPNFVPPLPTSPPPGSEQGRDELGRHRYRRDDSRDRSTYPSRGQRASDDRYRHQWDSRRPQASHAPGRDWQRGQKRPHEDCHQSMHPRPPTGPPPQLQGGPYPYPPAWPATRPNSSGQPTQGAPNVTGGVL